ncbi:MAG TPA: hypothetical protein VNZ23_18195 [Xanthobacteraceae bacterium]|jgi:hypothetical protein|nr:hypothetical protein [Xanthobacteraceae bacterium]
MTTDRERLLALLDALDGSETTLQRDMVRGEGRTGDWGIRGQKDRKGNDANVIYPDGAGYLLYVTPGEKTGKDGIDREPSPRSWKDAKAKLSFCQITQDGDWEGCLRLDRLPNLKEAEAIRDVLGIRKRRHLSAEEKESRSINLSIARSVAKSAKRPPPMRSAA